MQKSSDDHGKINELNCVVAHCANFCLPTSPRGAMVSASDCGGISWVRIPSKSCGILHPALTGSDLRLGVGCYFVVSKGHGMCPAYIVSEWATLNTTEVAAVRRAGQPTNGMACLLRTPGGGATMRNESWVWPECRDERHGSSASEVGTADGTAKNSNPPTTTKQQTNEKQQTNKPTTKNKIQLEITTN